MRLYCAFALLLCVAHTNSLCPVGDTLGFVPAGQKYLSEGKFADAMACFKKALRAANSPIEKAPIQQMLALASIQLKKFTDAENYLRDALKTEQLTAKTRSVYRMNVGQVLFLKGSLLASVKTYLPL